MPAFTELQPHSCNSSTKLRRAPGGRLLSWMPLALVIGFAGLQSGCAAVESGGEMMRESFRIFKPRTTDYRDVSEEEADEWSSAGKEARGNRPLDKENDPIRDWTMSPRARSIERNLGFD